jgi:starch phosphorylase
MALLTPRYSANRTVREYTEEHYLPAAAAYHVRMANKGANAKMIIEWQHNLEKNWATLRFGEVKVDTIGELHVFEIQVFLADLDPKAVHVELYSEGINGGVSVTQEMKVLHPLTGKTGGYVYSAAVSSSRPSAQYTARVIPHCDGVSIPLEESRILWQR